MGTNPLAGVYHNRTVFIDDAILRLANTLDYNQPHYSKLIMLTGGGTREEWSVQEWQALAIAKNGRPPFLKLCPLTFRQNKFIIST
jgi:hypothetical protein